MVIILYADLGADRKFPALYFSYKAGMSWMVIFCVLSGKGFGMQEGLVY